MTAEPPYLYCPHCERECLTETPPCVDGHGELCPDRACVECGTALLLDAPLIQLALPGRRPIARRAVRSPRHAA
ncbi:hypothetical protein SAMN05443575_2652 [Jatrophihabitans endophyticus]|uniref:Uncharacterized protein n=1 Tax=Jatrophihabitans endophyticus TaxID=1206085 RepID=A0A1M5M7T3_9ACTN|nr:hypothetical protein [Jatrophihabitans endophyticus]SHG73322.1 hypothetical protein SAMN05443575_2652 [Jatrophihabitans endophyticus]